MSFILERINNSLVKAGLKPIHTCTVLFYYMPIKGGICYGILSTQMFSPELYENFKFLCIPKHLSLTNACLMNSFLGASLYLVSRPHLRSALPRDRMLFALYGGAMFNLGSVLMWALGRTIAPENVVLRAVIGLASAAGSLYIGTKYVGYLDSKALDDKKH